MKFTFLSVLASVLAVGGSLVAAEPQGAPAAKPPPGPPGPPGPKAPPMQYLYTVNITGGEPAIVGQGPKGFRIVVPILRGNFSGPKLKGTLLPTN